MLNYLYIGLLVLSFMMALGNRPQASSSGYTAVFVGFALLMMYMMAASLTVAWQGLANATGSDRATSRDIIISLISSLGLYVFSSIIALDPWHILSSFIQYLLISPSYISVLNVYAFANIHDVSWGTKADTTLTQDLAPVVADPEKPGVVQVTELSADKDIDTAYQNATETHLISKELRKDPAAKPAPDLQQQQADFFKAIRTYVCVFCNRQMGELAHIIVRCSCCGV
ncbi:hypothetical protein H0H81_011432 [Sphagnurus paluster]|uniref:chitin synthase n=1 Tax=Sphagnurus paluster TaxID=117069 RepID=A0A9P7GUJ4_9AGAR|nr:hypothetical protein H0H81_011432 [Sphagnurus paluster]